MALVSHSGWWKCSITEWLSDRTGPTSDTWNVISPGCSWKYLSFNSLDHFIILCHYHKGLLERTIFYFFFPCSKRVPNSGEMIHSELTFYATVYSIALNVRSVLSVQLSAYCPSLKGRLVQECVCEAYSAFSLPAGFSARSHVWWYMEKCCVRRKQDLLSPLGRISELIKRSPYEQTLNWGRTQG